MRGWITDPNNEDGIVWRDVLDEPTPGPGRAVIQVQANSLNRGEILHVQRYRSLPPGTVPGWDVAGVVLEAATDKTGPGVGTRVFGWSDRRGTWAERVALSVDSLAVTPEGLGVDDASTLGVAALTAYAALGRCPVPLPGAHVVVTGATGGVGSFAVQLAQLAGSKTTAVLRAGADPNGVQLPDGVDLELGIDPDGPPADLVVDSVGGEVLAGALRRVGLGGTVVTLGRTLDEPSPLPPGWFQKHAQLHGLSFSRDYTAPGVTTAALTRIAGLVVGGRLTTNLSRVGNAEDLVTLIDELVTRRARGKVVMRWA